MSDDRGSRGRGESAPNLDDNELIRLRREKLDSLRSRGIDPFGGRYPVTQWAHDLAERPNSRSHGRSITPPRPLPFGFPGIPGGAFTRSPENRPIRGGTCSARHRHFAVRAFSLESPLVRREAAFSPGPLH